MINNKIPLGFLSLVTATSLLLTGCNANKTSSLETTLPVITTINTGVNEIPTGKIAFESDRNNIDELSTEIYTMNPDGSNQKRITPYTGGGWEDSDYDPIWSPNGAKIAYSSYSDGTHIVNSDGTGEVHLTSAEVDGEGVYPSWSPDGNRIAFASEGQALASVGQIYIANADGSNPTRLTYAKEPYGHSTLGFSYSAWSPDGSKILSDCVWAFSGDGILDAGGIYIFYVNTRNYTQLTHGYSDQHAVWSPDGSKIAFIRFDTDNNSEDDTNIYVMNSDGSGATKLTSGDNPSWSPDGSKIAFTSNKSGNALQLYVIHPDGSGETNVMSSLNDSGVDLKPSWSPDGKKLVFEYMSEIYIVNGDGSGSKKITTGAYASSAVWSPK